MVDRKLVEAPSNFIAGRPKAARLFCLLLVVSVFYRTCCFSGEPKENQGRGSSLPPPSNFISGRPKAALLFWFFGDFRCGVLFMVILVIDKYNTR